MIKKTVKWMVLAVATAFMAGSSSAFFLWALESVTVYREAHIGLLLALPVVGLAIGTAYKYWGQTASRGNNLIIEEIRSPQHPLPWQMAPLILATTLLTHLFGGSAGREGTAVQMSSALADRLSPLFKLDIEDRRLLLRMGVAAGFAAVFGTPLAGTLFAFEFSQWRQLTLKGLPTVLIAAFLGDFCCRFYGIGHSHYVINIDIPLPQNALIWAVLVGVSSGLTAFLYIKMAHFWTEQASIWVKSPLWRPFWGGAAIALSVYFLGKTTYIGLGLPTLQAAFLSPIGATDFLWKILFTTFTLGVGFKGGEVTPLFFIGATLGNALSAWIPLPLSLLAAMGFTAVFAAASHTPIACTLMAIELFGGTGIEYTAIAIWIAPLFVGQQSIYTSQCHQPTS